VACVPRGFCGKCGSPLTYGNSRVPDEVHVPAGALGAADALPRYTQTRRNGPPVRHGPRQ